MVWHACKIKAGPGRRPQNVAKAEGVGWSDWVRDALVQTYPYLKDVKYEKGKVGRPPVYLDGGRGGKPDVLRVAFNREQSDQLRAIALNSGVLNPAEMVRSAMDKWIANARAVAMRQNWGMSEPVGVATDLSLATDTTLT
jgi:hypothetical protein